ncbi:MAG: hypothetical protein ACD_35C00040G0004, partial [uncultured bacterium]
DNKKPGYTGFLFLFPSRTSFGEKLSETSFIFQYYANVRNFNVVQNSIAIIKSQRLYR